MPSPNDITSVVWSAANLPDGLTLGESTGIISGTPTTPGTYTTNVTVVTNWGTDTKSLTIVVAVPDSWKPVITPGQTLNLVAGEEMEPYQITGTNLQLTPSLPSLESIISDNDWHLIHEYLKLNGTNDFVVGTEVTTTYTESTGPNAGVEYELPLILVDKSTAVTQSGEEVPALYFMSKYALPCTGSHVADAQGSLNGIVGVEFQNSPTIYAQQMTAPVNRYRDSAIRKWLNGTGSDWWSAQEGIAEPSYSSKQGFLSCISQDLASEIQPIKVQVHTASDSKFGDGSTDVMYDKVFLPSIEEVNRYINYLGGESDDALRAADGVEGHAWQYWKDAWNSEERVQSILNLTGNEPDAIQFYDLDAKEKKTGVWLRSARRDTWYDVWLYINNATQSTVDNRGAYAQYFRVAPCFAILGV